MDQKVIYLPLLLLLVVGDADFRGSAEERLSVERTAGLEERLSVERTAGLEERLSVERTAGLEERLSVGRTAGLLSERAGA